MATTQIVIKCSPIALAASIFLGLAGIRVSWTALAKVAGKGFTGRSHHAIGSVVPIIEFVGTSHCAVC